MNGSAFTADHVVADRENYPLTSKRAVALTRLINGRPSDARTMVLVYGPNASAADAWYVGGLRATLSADGSTQPCLTIEGADHAIQSEEPDDRLHRSIFELDGTVECAVASDYSSIVLTQGDDLVWIIFSLSGPSCDPVAVTPTARNARP